MKDFSREYTSTFLDQGEDLGRIQYRLSTNCPIFTSSPHIGFHRCLEPPIPRPDHFSSLSYLWLGGFLPYRHVVFWALCSVKSIFTLSLDFLLLFSFLFFVYCLCLLSFALMCLCGLYLLYLSIFLYFHFNGVSGRNGINISVCHI